MSSPFPGMDPYLEDHALWPAFHHQFIQTLHQMLQPSLIDRYQARVNQRQYACERAEHHEDYIEIHQRSNRQLITLLEVVSPANKVNAAGRTAYLRLRSEGKKANANLVKIDLVLQGQPTLEYSRDGLPDWDYAVTVTRTTQPERYEIYTATLRKKLPRFRLPLAPDDRDTVLDLQIGFARCYLEGAFAKRIDYRREPPIPLNEEDRRWINDLLTSQRLREPTPTDDEIARAAYFLWEQEGCPHGRDQDYWYRAIELLKQQKRSTPTGPNR